MASLEEIIDRISAMKDSLSIVKGQMFLDSLDKCIESFEIDADEVNSVISLIDDEPWVNEFEFQESSFSLPEFHRSLAVRMSDKELEKSNGTLNRMTEAVQDLVYKSASLMKRQFSINVQMGPPQPLKTFGEYLQDFHIAYEMEMGIETAKTIHSIAELWCLIQNLNTRLPRPFKFSFEVTPNGREMFILDNTLMEMKSK